MGLFVFSLPALALPIDWNGSLGFDTTLINNICRSGDDVVNNTPSGTQGIQCDDGGAHFQSYVFKLNPHLIVNDAVSVKGEFSTGYARGGFMGDGSTQSQDTDAGSNAYYSTVPAQRSALNVNQLYAELYADTAMVKVGRFAKGYGLGAILDEGKETFDRFFTQYDGIQGEMRIGNFALTPHWARLGTYDETKNRGEPNGSRDVREMGLIAGYENKNTNLTMSLAYTKRFSESSNDLLYASSAQARGKTSVTLLDAYIAKKWEKFNFKLEVPMMSGDYGNVYNNGSDSQVSATAILLETSWAPSAKWEWGLHAGQVGGDKGGTQRFEGMALNPNYHVAELMFRYNWPAFNEGSNSIYDAHMTNVRFFKLHGHYKTDRWTWNGAVVLATAMETATPGQAWHHEENYVYTATQSQDDSYGTEIDAGFDYQWNPNVKVSAFVAYWMVGDYYAFTNSATELALDNVMGTGGRIGIDF
jgi:hypothetical protein